MSEAIAIQNLSFSYGKNQILKDINIVVPKGSIFGFIGHNGAGKTTTIKLILDLINAKSEQVYVLGKDISTNRNWCLSKIGSLVEYPGIYLHLSAYDNLKAKAIALNIDNQRIDEVLQLVRLDHVKNKKAKSFSQGMKQRLGIALALLNNPDILILDEPTNGLDPNGILEIRNLLVDLAAQNKTVFISSHLLSEVEKFCTHVAIIDGGKIVYSGEMNDLKKNQTSKIMIDCDQLSLATHLLEEKNIDYEIKDRKIYLYNSFTFSSADINRMLVFAGVNVSSISTEKDNLENIFFTLTNKAS
jgi:ABC-2 type transport system ATP-binding protein